MSELIFITLQNPRSDVLESKTPLSYPTNCWTCRFIGPYPKSNQSNPQPNNLLLQIHCNIILFFKPRLLKSFIHFKTNDILSTDTAYLPLFLHAHNHFIPLYFIILIIFSFVKTQCLSVQSHKLSRSRGRKQRERRRFAVYSMYAWGLPSAITTITADMDVLHLSPAVLKPDMGVYCCWFSSNTAWLC
jgi:hypothetical protein